jgi:hypothetical protein
MEIWGVCKLWRCEEWRETIYINVILRYHQLRDPRFVFKPVGRVGLGPRNEKVICRERPGGRGQLTRGTSTCC